MTDMKHIILILVHGAIYAGFALIFGRGIVLAPMLCLGLLLIWVSVVDIQIFEIPDMAAALLMVTGLFWGWQNGVGLWMIIAAAITWGGVFWVVAALARRILERDALGLGDAKLMGGVGAWLGFVAPIYVILAASLAGIDAMIAINLARREGISEIQGKAVAFGPFLCLSTWVIWLNISEKRRPQDGRAQIPVRGRTVDLRLSTLPTQHGESVVVRVLD